MSPLPDLVDVRFHLAGPGITMGATGWTELRAFIDHVADALAGMRGGPKPESILPVAVRDGSLESVIRVPRAALPVIERLRRGPRRGWAHDEEAAAARLYAYLDDRRAALSLGRRKLKPLEGRTAQLDWGVRERMSATGMLHALGGEDGTVKIRFPGVGLVTCRAGRAMVRRLGPHIYERVSVEGVRCSSGLTGKVFGFEIEDFRAIGPEPPGAETWANIHAAIGDELADLDVHAAMAELRG